MFYALHPEVAGGLGPNTVMDRTTHPPKVENLHYEFDDWLGDDLIATFPCFVVTNRLREAIQRASATGCTFADLEISKSELFSEINPLRKLPQFHWLIVTGRCGRDDFGISNDNQLVVSERIFDAMRHMQLQNCEVQDFNG